MRFIVAVMTHNPLSTLRLDLLERTMRSVKEAFPDAERILFDNNSQDGSWDLMCGKSLSWLEGWSSVRCTDGNGTPGAGRNRLLGLVVRDGSEPRGIVMSDDDMLWRAGAQRYLDRLWSHQRMPEDLAIVSGLLEPDYPWNTPRKLISMDDEEGPLKVLIRDSAPGAGWTFVDGGCRHGLGPLCRTFRDLPSGMDVHGRKQPFIEDFGYDTEACKFLASSSLKLRVGQVDLAEHIGWGRSTHGNEAIDDMRAKPLDRERWGI